MTLLEVQKKMEPKRNCSLVQVRRYVRKLGIKPIGNIRTRPRLYPDDTADRILTELGLKLVTLTQLRAERRRAQKARAA